MGINYWVTWINVWECLIHKPDSYFAFRRILRVLTRSLHRDHRVWVLLYDSIKWCILLIHLNLFSNVSSGSTWTLNHHRINRVLFKFQLLFESSIFELRLIRIRGRKRPHTWGISVLQRERLPLCYFCPAKPFSSFTCACVSQAVRMRCTSGGHARLWKVCVHTLNDPLPERPVPDCSDLSVGGFSFPAA